MMLSNTFTTLMLICCLVLILETTNGFNTNNIVLGPISSSLSIKPYLISSTSITSQQQQLNNVLSIQQDNIICHQQTESPSSQVLSLFHGINHDESIISSSSSFISSLSSSLLLQSNSGEDGILLNGLILLPGILFVTIAVGAFVYANVFITPEIIEANEQMRNEQREIQIRKLVDLVQSHLAVSNQNIEELRYPLEEAFGMSIEEYIVDVLEENPNTTIHYTSADRDLAQLLKTDG